MPATEKATLVFVPGVRRLLDFSIGVVGLLAALVITNTHRMPLGLNEFMALRFSMKNCLLLAAFLLLWSVIGETFGLYRSLATVTVRCGLRQILNATAVSGVCALIFPATSVSHAFPFKAILPFLAIVIAGRAFIFLTGLALERRRASRSRMPRRVLIVGSGPRALESYRQYQQSQPVEILGFFDHDLSHLIPSEIRARLLGKLTDLESFLTTHVVDEVMVAMPVKSCYAEIELAIRICERVGTPVSYRVDLFPHRVGQVLIEECSTGLVTSLKPSFREDLLAIKRLTDIVGASAVLLVLSPVLLLAALAIKLTSAGPILFVQERYGLHKRRFNMLKFRTMVRNAGELQGDLESQNEAAGPVFKIKADPRITPLGRLLRKTSIDELPQLINVLRGEMSLVGPRPLPLRDVSRFGESWLMRRFSVKPGLTCIWQVNGRSNASFDTWIGQDLTYIDTWSLRLDFEILLKTLPAVLRGSGAM